MTPRWVISFESGNGDPSRHVGGLNLALRSALAAQRAGAGAIHIDSDARLDPGLLDDARLTIPVVAEPPAGCRAVVMAADQVVHPAAFRVLAAALAEGHSLSLEQASQQVDSPYRFAPVVVTDAAAARRAENQLFRALRKSEDGWTARALNRPISLALSRRLVRTAVSPNQVSIAILGVGLVGAWLASRGTYFTIVLGALLFQAQSILDGCDGEMSRVTYRTSLRGEWLDTIGDDVTNYAFFGAAAWGLTRTADHGWYAVAGAVTVCAGVLASLIEYRYLLSIGSGDLLKYPGSHDSSKSRGLGTAIAPLFKRDTFVLLTLFAALFGWMGPALVIFAVGAVLLLLNVIRTEIRLARDRRVAAERTG